MRRHPREGFAEGLPARGPRASVVAVGLLALALLGPAACADDGRSGAPAGTPSAECQQAPEPGFRSLFDGSAESLRDWRQAGPGRFVLEDCALRTSGGMGLLWYARPVGPHELRVDWRAEGADNSGVFVGFPDPGDDPWVAVSEGREVQIDGDDVPVRSTGAVYEATPPDVPARDAALSPPGEWNTFSLTVTGERVVVRLNGVVVTTHEEDDPQRLVLPGHVGLQNHGDDDEVSYRRVRVRELTDEEG